MHKKCWHHKLWRFSHFFKDDREIPTETTVCSYWLRVVFGPFLVSVAVPVVMAGLALVVVLVSLAFLVSGVGYPSFSMSDDDFIKRYEPVMLGTVGSPIPTPMPLLVGALYTILLIGAGTVWLMGGFSDFYALGTGCLVVSATGHVFLVVLSTGAWRTWKKKLCPVVSFDSGGATPESTVV